MHLMKRLGSTTVVPLTISEVAWGLIYMELDFCEAAEQGGGYADPASKKYSHEAAEGFGVSGKVHVYPLISGGIVLLAVPGYL